MTCRYDHDARPGATNRAPVGLGSTEVLQGRQIAGNYIAVIRGLEHS